MTQADVISKHLRTNKKITSVEAIGLYGITRLAAVIERMKSNGVAIHTEVKKGVRATYAEYSLILEVS